MAARSDDGGAGIAPALAPRCVGNSDEPQPTAGRNGSPALAQARLLLACPGRALDPAVLAKVAYSPGRHCHFDRKVTAMTARLLCKSLRNDNQ
jgi:hypothetical protein